MASGGGSRRGIRRIDLPVTVTGDNRAMQVFFSPSYAAAGHRFETTRKAGWIADSLTRLPIEGVQLVAPEPDDGRSIGARARTRLRECRPDRPAARARGIEWVPVGCRLVDRGVCVDRRRGQRRARGVSHEAECRVVVERAPSCLDGVRKRLLHVQRSRAWRARGAGAPARSACSSWISTRIAAAARRPSPGIGTASSTSMSR